MSYRLRVSRRAESQIRVAGDWWLENRPKAPEAFSEEIEVRRVFLGRIRYYLYYQAFPATEIIEVLAVWHASRGKEPSF